MRARERPKRARKIGLHRAAPALAGLAVAAAVGCALGPETAPGCKADSDCDPGFVCDEGACFRTTTGHGDAGDAAAE